MQQFALEIFKIRLTKFFLNIMDQCNKNLNFAQFSNKIGCKSNNFPQFPIIILTTDNTAISNIIAKAKNNKSYGFSSSVRLYRGYKLYVKTLQNYIHILCEHKTQRKQVVVLISFFPKPLLELIMAVNVIILRVNQSVELHLFANVSEHSTNTSNVFSSNMPFEQNDTFRRLRI